MNLSIRDKLRREYPVRLWQWMSVLTALTLLWAGGIWGVKMYASDRADANEYAVALSDWDDCMDEVRAHNILTAIIEAIMTATGPEPEGGVQVLLDDLQDTVDTQYPTANATACGPRPVSS